MPQFEPLWLHKYWNWTKSAPKWDPLETVKLRIWGLLGHLMTSLIQVATTMLIFVSLGPYKTQFLNQNDGPNCLVCSLAWSKIPGLIVIVLKHFLQMVGFWIWTKSTPIFFQVFGAQYFILCIISFSNLALQKTFTLVSEVCFK